MKIPYVVSGNVRQAYATSSYAQASAGEASRRVVAEDFEWDTSLTPAPLSFIAAEALSRIFHRINPLPRILQKDRDILMDLYPVDIPLRNSVPLIKDEQYWKRIFAIKFPRKAELGIKYFKGKYLSACLQDYLENVSPDVFVEEEAIELATLVSPYIYELKLNELRMVRQPPPVAPAEELVDDTCEFSVDQLYDHIPLETVLMRLYNLQEITLIFGVNNLEENYLPRYFEFTVADCESLCRGLEHLAHLRTFRINRSNLDCSKVKVILEQLVKKESLEELDFCHCKIGNYGMKALGGFLMVHKSLRVLRIANNRFKEEGIQGIAYALQMQPAAPIELVDFSLNPMSIECATMFAAAFVRCRVKPQTLIVNSCGFYGVSAVKMAGLLCLNRGLLRLDMAANDLSGLAEEALLDALEMNKAILTVDLRRTNVSEKTLAKVQELLQRNRQLRDAGEREPSADIPPLYLDEPEYLVWRYNPNNPDHEPGRYPPRVAEV